MKWSRGPAEDEDHVSVEDCPTPATIINQDHRTGQVERSSAEGNENVRESIGKILVAWSDGDDPRARAFKWTLPSAQTAGLCPVPPSRLPFGRVGIDHFCPFQLSKRGNRHVKVSSAYRTKWVGVRPVASMSA